MEKNDIISLRIDDFSHDGKGIGHHEGMAIFIDNAIKGELIDAKIIKVLPKKNMAIAIISEIKKESPERIRPKCEYKACGGCQLHHMSYKEELNFKKTVVENSIRKIGKLKIEINDAIGAENPFYYRSKVSVPIGKSNFKAVTGFYATRSHDIIPIETCLVQPSLNDSILKIIREWIDRYKISVYNEVSKEGKLRHVMIRNGDDEIMVVLVSTNKRVGETKKLVETLKSFNKKIVSVILNVNNSNGNRILGETNIVLHGKEFITASISDIKFDIGVDTFFQINPEQTEVLYTKALEVAKVNENDIVIDTYSGVGSLTLFLAKKAKKVIGFEINENSVEKAFQNAKKNKIENVDFIAGDVTTELPKWVEAGNKCDILVLDPPRKGATTEFWDSVIKVSPRKIIYISCYPATLARDLNYIKDLGYITKDVTPIDMFPKTHHIETVTLIEKEEIE
jgi:23S rRNA (uracil1939-C5)-methyltransferase